MQTPIIVALVAAFAAIIGHIVNQIATHRLRLKEFRVEQINLRISTLEKAAVFAGPDSPTPENEPERDQTGLIVAVQGIINGAYHRISATERQFNMYRSLLKIEGHREVDNLLNTCNKKGSEFAVMSVNPNHDPNKLNALLLDFAKESQGLRDRYESLRRSSIEGLYSALKKEVGV